MDGKLTGQNEEKNISEEEADILDRSAKKIKSSNTGFVAGEAVINYEDIYPEDEMEDQSEPEALVSFKEKLMGAKGKDKLSGSDSVMSKDDEEMLEDLQVKSPDFKIVEDPDPEVDCPEFIFSSRVEKFLAKDFEFALVVSLLGKNIGFRALESRLKSMWAKRGIFSLVNLGFDHYLVNFSNAEDMENALLGGPWMIYDHYLIVKRWFPNFDPETAQVDRVAAWIRIEKLPFAYYNEKVLEFMGDRFGKTVKVDFNTAEKTRGKYARICVEVDLTKPLTPSFKLKGKLYNIQYEGLHNLCLGCGRYGHNMSLCPQKKVEVVPREEKESSRNYEASAQEVNLPVKNTWTVVQKPRRQKQTKEQTKNKNDVGHPKETSGSRFMALSDIQEEDREMNGQRGSVPRVSTAERTSSLRQGANLGVGSVRLGSVGGEKQRGKKVAAEKDNVRGGKSQSSQLEANRISIPKENVDVEDLMSVPETPLEVQKDYPRQKGAESSGIKSGLGLIEKTSGNIEKEDGPGPESLIGVDIQGAQMELVATNHLIQAQTSVNSPNPKLLIDKGIKNGENNSCGANNCMEIEECQNSEDDDIELPDLAGEADHGANFS